MNTETVDLYWFRPSIDDRVITLRPVGVSLCVGLIVLCCSFLQGCLQPLFISVEMVVVRLDHEVYSYYLRSGLGSPVLLYIVQGTGVLVGYKVEVLIGLHVSSPSRITYKES
jgi:hypothetical protein